ncbi:hypothetical protein D210916BOD24_10830 [Alteromonas sp. D210916BOD_24]|uniref:hypothetical protein n=1 Tax=Alteromonas sp. D210916BOD_24 TaxID=3157618 RepID=UPI00399CBF5D
MITGCDSKLNHMLEKAAHTFSNPALCVSAEDIKSQYVKEFEKSGAKFSEWYLLLISLIRVYRKALRKVKGYGSATTAEIKAHLVGKDNNLFEELSKLATNHSFPNVKSARKSSTDINAPAGATHFDEATGTYIEQDLALHKLRSLKDITYISALETQLEQSNRNDIVTSSFSSGSRINTSNQSEKEVL